MRRPIVIALLAFGTVAGYASGFAHMHAWRHAHCACADQESPSHWQ
jgi:hypothetical protein